MGDVEPRRLRYFVSISDHGSISRAAEQLRISQPSAIVAEMFATTPPAGA